jgi:hypothetical protein
MKHVADILVQKWDVNILSHGHGMKEFGRVQHLLVSVFSVPLRMGPDLKVKPS